MKLSHIILILVFIVSNNLVSAQSRSLFTDDFERGLDAWDIYGSDGVSVMPSGDPTHGHVMVLRPNGDVHALIKGSEQWGGVRIDGDALFPTNRQSYLGFLYNFQRRGGRMDFGNIYLKGNGSYLQVNPHRDYNVGRTLYPELVAMLTGEDSVRIGEWLQFRFEVIGPECHVYIGDMKEPKIVFAELELRDGALGLQPRSVGDSVWIDNVSVSAIDGFGYTGPRVPEVEYVPGELLTDWEVLGPLEETADAAARGSGVYTWRPYDTDSRGAVVTGRIVDAHGPHRVAYFRTTIHSERGRTGILHFSTIDDLSIWVNGRFHWFLDRGSRAWHDFGRNADHQGQRIPVDLIEGTNTIVVRVLGGIYATGGFFVRSEEDQHEDEN